MSARSHRASPCPSTEQSAPMIGSLAAAQAGRRQGANRRECRGGGRRGAQGAGDAGWEWPQPLRLFRTNASVGRSSIRSVFCPRVSNPRPPTSASAERGVGSVHGAGCRGGGAWARRGLVSGKCLRVNQGCSRAWRDKTPRPLELHQSRHLLVFTDHAGEGGKGDRRGRGRCAGAAMQGGACAQWGAGPAAPAQRISYSGNKVQRGWNQRRSFGERVLTPEGGGGRPGAVQCVGVHGRWGGGGRRGRRGATPTRLACPAGRPSLAAMATTMAAAAPPHTWSSRGGAARHRSRARCRAGRVQQLAGVGGEPTGVGGRNIPALNSRAFSAGASARDSTADSLFA